MLRTVVCSGTWGIPHANVMDVKQTLVGPEREQKHSAARHRAPVAIKAHSYRRFCYWCKPEASAVASAIPMFGIWWPQRRDPCLCPQPGPQ